MRGDFYPVRTYPGTFVINTVNGLFRRLVHLQSSFVLLERSVGSNWCEQNKKKQPLSLWLSLLSRFNRTRTLNELQVDSGLFSSNWHTSKLLYESWKTMPGTTLLGWSKRSLLCCVFLPLIGPNPMLGLSMALLLLLVQPEDGQQCAGQEAGWLGNWWGWIQEHPESIITSKSVRTCYHSIDGFCGLVFVIGWQGLAHSH